MSTLKKGINSLGNLLKKHLVRKSSAALGGLSESMLQILIAIGIMAGVGVAYYVATSGTKTVNTQSDLIQLRSKVNQAFQSSGSYSGLTNDVARKLGTVPESFIRGTKLVNAWAGDITLAPLTDNSGFTITLTKLPREICPQLGGFQTSSWISVKVNTTTVPSGNVATLSTACDNDVNTIIFTAR